MAIFGDFGASFTFCRFQLNHANLLEIVISIFLWRLCAREHLTFLCYNRSHLPKMKIKIQIHTCVHGMTAALVMHIIRSNLMKNIKINYFVFNEITVTKMVAKVLSNEHCFHPKHSLEKEKNWSRTPQKLF